MGLLQQYSEPRQEAKPHCKKDFDRGLQSGLSVGKLRGHGLSVHQRRAWYGRVPARHVLEVDPRAYCKVILEIEIKRSKYQREDDGDTVDNDVGSGSLPVRSVLSGEDAVCFEHFESIDDRQRLHRGF